MKFSAEKFFHLGHSLGDLERRFALLHSGPVPDQTVESYDKYFSDCFSQCFAIGLRQSAKASERAIKGIRNERTAECIHHHLNAFAAIVHSEMEDALFWHVPVEFAEWYGKDAETILGTGAAARFKSARPEIEEAAKCFVLERPTACVFHLMRATEIVLKAVFKSGGWHPPKLAESWGAMMGPMDEQLQKPPKNPVPIWQSNIGFFSELVADLRAVKRAQRDTTMHVESTYTQSEARLILDGVVSLFHHAAKHLDETGAFTP
ncbi:MAG TPA: hypothetical protein VGM54_18910 [Chthoniobacter sp.]|jgi:hypothetical protein